MGNSATNPIPSCSDGDVFLKTTSAASLENDDTKIIGTVVENYNKMYDEAMTLTEKVNKKAPEIQREAERQAQEVTKLYEQGEEYLPDGTPVRTMEERCFWGDEVMTEYDKDGNVTRKSLFDKDGVTRIHEGFSSPTEYEKGFWFEKNQDSGKNKLYEYEEGVETQTADIASMFTKITKMISFDTDGKILYGEEVKHTEGDPKITAAKALFLTDGVPIEYREGHRERTSGLTERDLGYDKNLSFYKIGMQPVSQYIDDCNNTTLLSVNGNPHYIVQQQHSHEIANSDNRHDNFSHTAEKCYLNTSNGWSEDSL